MLKNKIKEIRIKKGIESISEMARRCKTSRNTIYNWENNVIQPSQKNISVIIKVLAVSYEELFYYED